MPDINMFYQNPMDDMTAPMQHRIFQCRFDQYLNALAHIMNTGQGVVLERSPYSDFVFTNAMRAKNFIGHNCIFLLFVFICDFQISSTITMFASMLFHSFIFGLIWLFTWMLQLINVWKTSNSVEM